MDQAFIANGWTTPQGEALRRGDRVALKKWLDEGGDPNMRFNFHCLLHMTLYGDQTTRADRSDMVRLLVSNGADINVRRGDGMMPIHLCSYPSEASLLLDLGADVDARTDDGRTPLFCFTFGGRLECARFIVRRGADVKLTADDDGWDAFEEAREEGTYDQCLADFVSAVRAAGGWQTYIRAPRIELVRLRLLCARGRARPPIARRDPILARLFSAAPSSSSTPKRLASRQLHRPIPNEVFWHILSYWRTSRDDA